MVDILSQIEEKNFLIESLINSNESMDTLTIDKIQLLYSEKEILRAISSMQYAFKSSPHLHKIFAEVDLLKNFHAEVSNTLEKLASSIETHEIDKNSIHLPEMQRLKEYIFCEAKKDPDEEMMYEHVFLFAAEQIVKQLKEILKLIHTPSIKNAESK